MTPIDVTPWTEQDAFNAVWNHFIVGGMPMSSFRGTCYYRLPIPMLATPLRCAIGVLISDEEYRLEFEDRSAEALACVLPRLAELPNRWLLELQRAHDRCSTDGELLASLTRFAADWSLTIPGACEKACAENDYHAANCPNGGERS